MRVPLVISVPGEKKTRSQNIVELIDIYPALCKLSGISIPENVQGQDLTEILKGDSSQLAKREAFSISLGACSLYNDQYRIFKTKKEHQIICRKRLTPNRKPLHEKRF